LNWDGFSNALPSPVNLILDTTLPDHIEQSIAVGPNGKDVGKYSDYARETEELYRLTMDALLELSQQIPIVNPSITIRTDRTFLEKSDRLLTIAYEAAAKSGLPNLLLQDGNESISASSDGCLMHSNNNISADSPRAKTIIGTVQVNVPRASYEAGGKDDRFFQLLHAATLEAVKALELRYDAVERRLKENLLPVFSWENKGRSYSDLKTASGEIALLGLVDAIRHHTHSEIWEKNNLVIAKKIVETIKQAVRENDGQKLAIHVGIHPSQEASTRLASIDAERFGFSTISYNGSKKYPYYTDAPVMPLTEKVPFATRVQVEGEMQKILDGGSIFPIVVKKPRINSEEIASASQQFSSSGGRYFTFSIFQSRCLRCYNVNSGMQMKCNKCGSENLTILAKNAGRLVPVDTWSEARRRDLERIVSYEFS
jgi:anaerobic ribonucleoside-triphosphate reductase